ncbi:ca2+ insensitive EF hand [Opisthorchis viverrini]|uniref:Ca2+ insensitive EF hand n=1 Tax=Opisthorchis viverrini TaxID=6198 RepID=A0A1S8X265_OPIVI|nr:ca2+ insensitive EF hand [Opisthorchis viverrini]
MQDSLQNPASRLMYTALLSVQNTMSTNGTPLSLGESDFSRTMQQVDPGHKGYVTFDSFLNFVTRENADEDTAEQITQSFKVLSGDKGYVTADDLRRYLPPDDAEYCIKRMMRASGPHGDSGALNYEQFTLEIYGSQKPK